MNWGAELNRDRQQAIEYLRAETAGRWNWIDHGMVLVWKGTTIAFRPEIERILEHLAPHGLPPFSAVAMLLAVTRGVFPGGNGVDEGSDDAMVAMKDDAAGVVPLRSVLDWRAKSLLAAALEQLRKVRELPVELRTGLAARCLLAEVAFEAALTERNVDARQVLRGLAQGLSDEELAPNPARPILTNTLARDAQMLADGLEGHTAESLTLRLRTGLDALPDATGPTLPPAERARRLIEELGRDPECGAVARAARDLRAAVRLPRRLRQKEELPLGGVSDITNRGPLDRLLLSELAHDDLTLSVRVALNEALYLRREPPMREPPGVLALLLDSGVRLWGVPRVLASAVALALVAQDRGGTQVLVWRGDGKCIRPVDLLTRQGLKEHLGVLATQAHVGDSLAAYGAALPTGVVSQAIVITHRDALSDPDFRHALDTHGKSVSYVATVTRDGGFELHALPLSRRPPVCQGELDLEAVFHPKANGVAGIPLTVDADLPAIFNVRPFPIRLPIAGRLEFWHRCEGGRVFGVLRDRRLVEFCDSRSGGSVLVPELPAGKTIWMEEAKGILHLLKGSTSHRAARLISFPLPDGPIQVTEMPWTIPPAGVHRYGDVVLAVGSHHVHVCSLESGRELDRKLNPYRSAGGRYLRGDRHFYVATWDGSSIRFEEISLPTGTSVSSVVAIFDREGVDGPWYVDDGGYVRSLGTDEFHQIPIPHGYTLDGAVLSLDGNGIFVTTPFRNWGCSLNLKTGVGYPATPGGNAPNLLGLGERPVLPAWNLFRVVEAVAVVDNGLALRGRRGKWRRLTLVNGRLEISSDDTEPKGMRHQVPFGVWDNTSISSLGCTLGLAEWPNGSRAWLDSRGLLHLRGRDPTLPEISFVLSSGEVAAWTSDGCRCGPRFFFQEPISPDPVNIHHHLLKFIGDLGGA